MHAHAGLISIFSFPLFVIDDATPNRHHVASLHIPLSFNPFPSPARPHSVGYTFR